MMTVSGAIDDDPVGCPALNNQHYTDDSLLPPGSNESKEINQGSVSVMFVAALMLCRSVTWSLWTSLLPSHKNQNNCDDACPARPPVFYPTVRCLFMPLFILTSSLVNLTLHFCEVLLTLIATRHCLRHCRGSLSLKLFILITVVCDSVDARLTYGSQGTLGGLTDFTVRWQ